MAWMSDEEYEYKQDCREKSIAARSARNKKTHTGKGGRVRLPSDNLSKKEREAMNGECIKYASLKKPMSWEEFKKLPKDLAVQYIKSLRKKYNVPDKNIAENVFHISPAALTKYNREVLELFQGKCAGGKRVWDKDGFLAWCGGAEDGVVKPSETPVEEEQIVTHETEPNLEEPVENDINREIFEHNYDLHEEVNKILNETESSCEANTVIPSNGEMTFQGNVDDILRTIAKLLDGRQVRLEVEWEVLG